MTDPVNVNRPDFVAIARAAWGDAPPDWILALAAEAMARSGTAAAKRIGYSGSVVSTVLRRSYGGDLGKVEAAVRGALMGETVACAGYGMEIGRDQCLREQDMPNTGASAQRARVYAECRSGRCPHSRIRGLDDVA